MTGSRTFLLASTMVLAGLLGQATAAFAQDLTVVWADDSNSDVTYDPRVTQSRHEEQVIVQVFDTLVSADENGKLYPGLAASWTVAPDNKSVTLKLREDVKFHDGTPFNNAEAVKFTFDTIVDPKTGSQGAVDMLGPYEGTDVLGPFEVRVRYKRPFADAVSSFSENELSPVSPTAVQKLGNTGFAQAPVGTGPFRFVSWEKGREVILERNPDYKWAPPFSKNKGPSKVSKIVHRFIPNAATRVAALEAGEVHISDITPPLDTKRLADSGKFKATVGVAAGLPYGILLNTSRGPFQEKAVREAFMTSIDRPKLSQNLFFGLAKPAWGPLAPSSPHYDKAVEAYYPFNRDKAAKMLEDAGWKVGSGGIREKNGQPLSVYAPCLLEPETCVAIQGDAKRVGIDVKVENVLKQKQDELIFANAYDLLPIRWVNNSASVLSIPFTSANIPEPGKFKFNWARWADPNLDKLLAEAASATSPADAAKLYSQAQKMIMDAAIFFPVHDQVQTVVHSSKITGLRYAAGQWQVRLHDVEPAN